MRHTFLFLLIACEVFEDVFSKITKKSFKRIVDKICDMFEEEDVFDSLIQFLTRSVQVLCKVTICKTTPLQFVKIDFGDTSQMKSSKMRSLYCLRHAFRWKL